jgi:hypothetical protein
MARSKTNSKSPGYEFWSRRPMMYQRGSIAKTFCHKIERQQSKTLTRKELRDNL